MRPFIPRVRVVIEESHDLSHRRLTPSVVEQQIGRPGALAFAQAYLVLRSSLTQFALVAGIMKQRRRNADDNAG